MVLMMQTWRIRQRRVALAGCKGSPPRSQSERRWSDTGGPACCLPVHQTSAGSLLQQGCRSGPVWPQMQDLHAAAVRCCTASVLACSDQPQLQLGPADQPEAAALAQDCSAQQWSRCQGCMHAAGPAAHAARRGEPGESGTMLGPASAPTTAALAVPGPPPATPTVPPLNTETVPSGSRMASGMTRGMPESSVTQARGATLKSSRKEVDAAVVPGPA